MSLDDNHPNPTAARFVAAFHAIEYLDSSAIDALLNQYQSDLTNPIPCQYDSEFLNAYFDRQVHLEIPDENLLQQRINTFERHLPACLACSVQLGQLAQLSDAYKAYLYQLETQLEKFDAASIVLQQYQATSQSIEVGEEADLLLSACGAISLEDLSAWIDGALQGDETLRIETHLTQCQPCHLEVEGLKSLTQQVQAQASSIHVPPVAPMWQAISQQLQVEHPPQVVPIQSKRYALPMVSAIAASLLIGFMVFRGNVPNNQPFYNHVEGQSLQAALEADQQEASLKPVPPNITYNVIYESPEAYLFSQETDLFSEDSLAHPDDISTIFPDVYQ